MYATGISSYCTINVEVKLLSSKFMWATTIKGSEEIDLVYIYSLWCVSE